MTRDFQFPWWFFLGHQACIYAHSIFVEQIKLVYFFQNIYKYGLVLFISLGITQ
jgi:hypothetical protein